MNRHLYFKQQEENELYHHGIKGQKWGIRRFQNEDGSYTEEGRKRYGIGENGEMSKSGSIKYYKDYVDTLSKEYDEKYGKTPKEYDSKYIEKKAKFIKKQYEKDGRNFEEDRQAYEKDKKIKRNIGIAAVGGTIATIGTVKVASDLNVMAFVTGAQINGMKRNPNWKDDVANDDTDMLIPAGSDIYRVTKNKNEQTVDMDGAFFNVNKKDANAYNQFYARGMANAAKGKMYERQVKNNESMKIAGGKAVQNAIDDVFKEHPDLIDYEGRANANKFISNYGVRDREIPGGDNYRLNKYVTEKLKEQGYQGFKDFNDINILGKGQVMIFNPNEKVTDKKQEHAINMVDKIVGGLAVKQVVYEKSKAQPDPYAIPYEKKEKEIPSDADLMNGLHDIWKQYGI